MRDAFVSESGLHHKPNAQRTTEQNSTQLNSTGSFSCVDPSSVQFSAVHWTGDELRRSTTAVKDSWLSRTSVVAGRRRFNAQRETELNWTVELSSVLRCALGYRPINSYICRPTSRVNYQWYVHREVNLIAWSRQATGGPVSGPGRARAAAGRHSVVQPPSCWCSSSSSASWQATSERLRRKSTTACGQRWPAPILIPRFLNDSWTKFSQTTYKSIIGITYVQ